MFRHIESKLIAAFAVPLAILVAVAGLEAVSSVGQIRSVDQETSMASASVGPGGVVQALQTERIYAILSIFTATHVSALAAPLQGLSAASDGLYESAAQLEAKTQTAVSSLRPRSRRPGLKPSPCTPARSRPSSRWPKPGPIGLPPVKPPPAHSKVVSNYEPLVTETYRSYTAMINALINDTAQVPLRINDPTLRTGVEALYTSLGQTESQWQVVEDLFVASWNSGTAEKNDINLATQDWGADQSWGQRLASLSNGAYATAISNLDQSPVNDAIDLDVGFMQAGELPPLSQVVQSFTEPAQTSTTDGTLTPTALRRQPDRGRGHRARQRAAHQCRRDKPSSSSPSAPSGLSWACCSSSW